MNDDFRKPYSKSFILMQKIRHIVMGLLFLGMAYGLINAEKYEIKALIDFGDFFRYFFAGICILYGLFRVYRGFKEQY